MNLSKSLEFFNPTEKVRDRISIIGTGAVGSYIATALARLGCTNIHLYDFDVVESKNIVNQMFTEEDIGMLKVDAVERMMKRINHNIQVTKHPEGLTEPLNVMGYVFLCVDNIDLRREIVLRNRYNVKCKCFLDCRMALTSGQHYFANNMFPEQVDRLLSTMDFTHEEAQEAVPVSACGTELGVGYNVQVLTGMAVMNFVKFCMGDEPFLTIFTDLNCGAIDCFH